MATLRKPWVKVVPEEWEKRLAEFSPRTTRFTWLKLIWEQGYPWEPVERYLVYQMVPGHAVDEAVLEQLEDPHPPSAHGNYYDTVKQEFIRNPDCLITERAWHMFRETGCWGRPYWVIQGENGGHKRWFTTVEKKLLRLANLPDEPPAPGDLPYAEFDDRVERHLRMLDLMHNVHNDLRRKKVLSNEGHHERQEALEKEFRVQLTRWLSEQVLEVGPDVHKGLLAMDAPRSKADPKKLEEIYEQAEQDFIDTGNSKAGLIRRA